MKKLLILLVLVGCEETDNRPYRESGFGPCQDVTYIYVFGADPKKQGKLRPFPTKEAAIQRVERDGCVVHHVSAYDTVTACCPRER